MVCEDEQYSSGSSYFSPIINETKTDCLFSPYHTECPIRTHNCRFSCETLAYAIITAMYRDGNSEKWSLNHERIGTLSMYIIVLRFYYGYSGLL